MQYVTPSQFKRMATGAVWSGTDADLSQIASLATSAVNRHCAAPKLPAPHDFRGGSIVNEQIDYPLGNTFWPGSDKVWVMHRPVRAVSRFFLRITPGQGVSFDPSDLYINATDGYIEVISLARRLSVFSAGFVPVLGMRKPVAELDYTYGWSFTSTAETLYATDGTYTVYAGENGWWDSTVAPVVQKNGTTVTPTINYDEGTVTFSPALTSTDVVTVTYTYTLPTDIFLATGLVMANAINANAGQAANLRGLEEIQVEETRLRWPMRTGNPVFEEFIDERVDQLLHAYKHFSWA